jgi:hypothetical protein
VDDLLTDNRTQLQRLLDLYLLGDFAKEVLTTAGSDLKKRPLLWRGSDQALWHTLLRNC